MDAHIFHLVLMLWYFTSCMNWWGCGSLLCLDPSMILHQTISKESFSYNSCLEQHLALVRWMDCSKNKNLLHVWKSLQATPLKNYSLHITIWELYCYSPYTNFLEHFYMHKALVKAWMAYIQNGYISGSLES